MLITPHAVVGATIVAVLPEKSISFPLAFLSHFILDTIPHWDFSVDFKSLHKLIPDAVLAFAAIGYMILISTIDWQLIVTGALLGLLPDIIQQLEHLDYIKLNWFFIAHEKIQHEIGMVPGILTQVVTIVISFYFLTIN